MTKEDYISQRPYKLDFSNGGSFSDDQVRLIEIYSIEKISSRLSILEFDDLNGLEALRKSNTRFMTQEEFDRLELLNNKLNGIKI